MSWFDRAISVALPAVPKPLVRLFSDRYIAGTTVDAAFDAVQSLAKEGAATTLDILGEFVTSLDTAEHNTRAYEELLARIHAAGHRDAHVSVKLTALGLLIDRSRCHANVRRLVSAARDTGNFVRIDMEDSPCTTPTLEIYRALRAEFGGHVGAVLQARLRRTLADAAAITAEPANVRLCKGIYLEPHRIAYTDPEIIRRNFVAVADLLMSRGAYVAIATHDELLVCETLRLAARHGLGRDRFEFQMLLGVQSELRRILLAEGWRLRVYVPFGEHWYAYSIRRLRENPQIAGHAFRALFQRTPIP